MGSNMKTTIEIADGLLDSARALAADEGTTVRSLVEEGLRLALDRHRDKSGFSLRQASFKGEGLQPGVSLEDWDVVRGFLYSGRGE
jgi:hypothetical protein